MFGAILGDIIGQPYEFSGIKSKEFPLIRENNIYTDDSVMTIAVAAAVLKTGINAEDEVLKK